MSSSQQLLLGAGASKWTPCTDLGSKAWRSVCCSADGTIVYACANNEYIYKSTDSGVTWTSFDSSPGTRAWTSITCSNDGLKVFAVVDTSAELSSRSIDGGATWTDMAIQVSSVFRKVICSTNGLYVFAIQSSNSRLKISSDSGLTWSDSGMLAGSASLGHISCSSAGNDVLVVLNGSPTELYKSTDFGVSFTAVSNAGYVGWRVGAISGSYIWAVKQNQYTKVSSDSGTTWSADTGNPVLLTELLTVIGATKLIGLVPGDGIYVSTVYTISWEKLGNPPNKIWSGLDTNSDLTKAYACADNDFVYKYVI